MNFLTTFQKWKKSLALNFLTVTGGEKMDWLPLILFLAAIAVNVCITWIMIDQATINRLRGGTDECQIS